MAAPFVWFDNIGSDRAATTEFLKATFGWEDKDIGPMTMLSNGDGPFAGTADAMKDVAGWVPYVEVDDLTAAADEALKHGAALVAADMKGPAGTATFVRDPGGAVLALWTRA